MMSNPPMPETEVAENAAIDVQAASATVLRMIQGLHISCAIYVAADLGIADYWRTGRAVPGTWPNSPRHMPRLSTVSCAY
jgi:hypothetical protein